MLNSKQVLSRLTYPITFPYFSYLNVLLIALNLSPWITKGIEKSSKRKQKLNEKFLKKRNAFNETAYKTYKNYLRQLSVGSPKKSLFAKDTPIQI